MACRARCPAGSSPGNEVRASPPGIGQHGQTHPSDRVLLPGSRTPMPGSARRRLNRCPRQGRVWCHPD